MALHDILVHIDETPHCAKRVKIALKIAKQNETGLTGIYAKADPTLRGFEPNMDKRHKEHNEASQLAQQKYQSLANEAGVELRWETAKFPSSAELVTDQMAAYTRLADLAIVGQHDEETNDGSVPDDMAERLVLETGRPVLVIPYAGEYETVGKKVVIAWNTGRESVRAVNDAIPLMTNADMVKVVAINPKKPGKGSGALPLSDITNHLIRHGLNAESDTFSMKELDEGNLILNTLAEEQADLLVMGAYGHHRFRELILGGVTQSIFKHMTTPVLMSH
jgi:nucleotide-binding universal stress UspA family protein